MKKVLISLFIGLVLGAVLCYFGLKKLSLEKVKPFESTSFKPVTSKLNPDGSLYFYMSTEKTLESIMSFLDKLGVFMTEVEDIPDKDNVKTVLSFVKSLLSKSGLMEMTGIGFSSVPTTQDLNHSRLVIHHHKGENKGLIWNLIDNKPHSLDSLNMLPASTALACFSDFRIKYFWEWLKNEAQNSGFPQASKFFDQVEFGLKSQGIELDSLLDSFGGEWGYFLTLNQSSKIKIPGGGEILEIAEPGLGVIIMVNDSTLFDFLKNIFPASAYEKEGNIDMLRIPVPAIPVPFEPLIIQYEKSLILVSHSKIFAGIQASFQDGVGLTAEAEFKALANNIPTKGNGYTFISSRLYQMFTEIQKQQISTSLESEKEVEILQEFMKLFPQEVNLYAVMQNGEEGLFYSMNHSMDLSKIMFLPGAIVFGLAPAVAIPNYLIAVEKAKVKKTMKDMVSIGMGIESYMLDFGYAPQGESLAELEEILVPSYFKTLPLQDAWGNDFIYDHGKGENEKYYAIASPGRDRLFLGWEQEGTYTLRNLHDFSNDIIFVNGAFVFQAEIN